ETVRSTGADAAILRDLRVLIVDDNATNRQILEKMLTHWRLRPSAVPGAEFALAALRDARRAGVPFQLMVVDCHMPEIDGFSLVEAVEADSNLRGITTMMLTSGGQRGDAARCRDLGISAYLTKPVLQSDLLQALLNVIGTQRTAPEPVHIVTRHTL